MTVGRFPSWAYTLIAVLPVLLFVAADFAFPDSPLDSIPNLVLIIPVMLWGFAFTCVAWRRLDESGREAHKFAWFFGATFGLTAALIAVIAVHYLPSGGDAVDAMIARFAPKWPEGQGGFALGILVAAIAQMVGYAVVWSGWWLAKRR